MKLLKEQTENTKEKLSLLNNELQDTEKAYRDGTIDVETYTRKKQELERQIQETNGELRVEEAQLRQTEKELKSATSSTEKFEKAKEAATKKITEFAKKLGGIALEAVKAFAVAAGVAGVAAIKIGSDFQAGMSTVKAISQASSKEMVVLTDKAREMGKASVYSATESAEAMKYMAQAGWKTHEMLDGIEGIINLAAGSGEEFGMVADIVTENNRSVAWKHAA